MMMMGALPGFGMSGVCVRVAGYPFTSILCCLKIDKSGGGRCGWVKAMVLNRDVEEIRAASHAELRCAAPDVGAQTHARTRGRFP